MLRNLLTPLLHAHDHVADLLGNGQNLPLWGDKSRSNPAFTAASACASITSSGVKLSRLSPGREGRGGGREGAREGGR